jgi:omega-hydroxypalmitate O-feruloyl transferase
MTLKWLVSFVLDFPSPQDKTYPLVFMVTKFLCGGFTIGMGVSHALCDGFGISQFFKAIVELANGKSEPSVKPVWERERLIGSITKQPFHFNYALWTKNLLHSHLS